MKWENPAYYAKLHALVSGISESPSLKTDDGAGMLAQLMVDTDGFSSFSAVEVVMEQPTRTGVMVVLPDQPMEAYIHFYSSVLQIGPSDFRIYYMSRGPSAPGATTTTDRSHVAVATNATGPFEKPQLGLIPFGNDRGKNNIIFDGILVSVFVDGRAGVASSQRIKAIVGDGPSAGILTSADGFRWSSENKTKVGWAHMADTQPIVLWDEITQQYFGYGRVDCLGPAAAAGYKHCPEVQPQCISTAFPGDASRHGDTRSRRIGVATARVLTPGCFNHSDTAVNDATIAMGFLDDSTSCTDLYTAQTVRYESHFLAFPSAYYHFPSTDPPNAPHGSPGKGNDGLLEAWLASSRTGLRFSFVGAGKDDHQRPAAWLPRGVGRFDTKLWRFHGDFDAGHIFVSHGWLKGRHSREGEDWDTVVMFHQGKSHSVSAI
jgi:hypothetical protein